MTELQDAVSPAWWFLSRFGEAQILLPALAALLLGWSALPQGRRTAACWLGSLAAAVGLTTLSKLAFIGWGWGWARFDFTGISGHAMFAAGVMPLLASGLSSAAHPARRRAAWTVAVGLAAWVAISRVVIGAHSGSEVLAGFALGLLASEAASRLAPPPASSPSPLAGLGAALLVLILLSGTPTAPTHALVTRLALKLSGHEQPYTREMLAQGRRLEH